MTVVDAVDMDIKKRKLGKSAEHTTSLFRRFAEPLAEIFVGPVEGAVYTFFAPFRPSPGVQIDHELKFD